MRRICRERRGILIGVLLAVLAGCHSVNVSQSPPFGVTAEPASTQTASGNKSSSDRPSSDRPSRDRPSGAVAPDRASPDRADSDSADFGPSLSGPPAAETPTVTLVPAQSICQNLQRQFEQIFLSTRQLHQRLFGLAEKQRRRLGGGPARILADPLPAGQSASAPAWPICPPSERLCRGPSAFYPAALPLRLASFARATDKTDGQPPFSASQLDR